MESGSGLAHQTVSAFIGIQRHHWPTTTAGKIPCGPATTTRFQADFCDELSPILCRDRQDCQSYARPSPCPSTASVRPSRTKLSPSKSKTSLATACWLRFTPAVPAKNRVGHECSNMGPHLWIFKRNAKEKAELPHQTHSLILVAKIIQPMNTPKDYPSWQIEDIQGSVPGLG